MRVNRNTRIRKLHCDLPIVLFFDRMVQTNCRVIIVAYSQPFVNDFSFSEFLQIFLFTFSLRYGTI